HARDPLGGMRLTEAAYGSMTRALVDVAEHSAGGKLALLLEGGYDLTALEASLSASVEASVGRRPDRRNERKPIADEHRTEIARARLACETARPTEPRRGDSE